LSMALSKILATSADVQATETPKPKAKVDTWAVLSKAARRAGEV
jgi:hypothetical protein